MREFTSRYLSDLDPDARINLACRRCDRKGRTTARKLIARHGNLALPDALRAEAEASTCPNKHASGADRCSPFYDDPRP